MVKADNDYTRSGRRRQEDDKNETTTPPATTTSATEWKIIPKEVVGKISTFLDINSVSNLLQVTRNKQNRQVIKTSFLSKNFYFLRRYIFGNTKNKIKQRVLAWMNVNKDWIEMYDYYPGGGSISKIDKDDFDKIFNDIMFSVKCSLLDIVKHLLEYRDVDVNTCKAYTGTDGDRIYGTPLSQAVIHSEPSMLMYILSNEDLDVNKVVDDTLGYSALHTIMAYDSSFIHPNNLRLLLLHPKININIQTNFGCTPLYIVCMNMLNSSPIWKTKMLIEFGADVNIRNTFGMTVLECIQKRYLNADVKETMRGLLQQKDS